MIFVVSLLLVLTAFGASSVVTPCPGRESHQMIPIELEVSSPIQQGQNLTVHVRGEAQQEIEPLANVQVFYRSLGKEWPVHHALWDLCSTKKLDCPVQAFSNFTLSDESPIPRYAPRGKYIFQLDLRESARSLACVRAPFVVVGPVLDQMPGMGKRSHRS